MLADGMNSRSPDNIRRKSEEINKHGNNLDN